MALFSDVDRTQKIDLRKTIKSCGSIKSVYVDLINKLESSIKSLNFDFHDFVKGRHVPDEVNRVKNYDFLISECRNVIRSIMFGDDKNENPSNNPLQADQFQVEALSKATIRSTNGNKVSLVKFLRSLTHLQWHKFFSPIANELFESIGANKKKEADQVTRAKAIAKEIVAKGIKDIVLMDGHGRITYLILDELKKLKRNYMNKCNFFLYDINETVTKWHELFFPKSFVCETKNVTFLDKVFLESKLLYLNYCGIGSLDDKKNLAKFFSTINFSVTTVFISFSNSRRNNPIDKLTNTRRVDKQKKFIQSPLEMITMKYLDWLDGIAKPYESIEVSKAPNNFYTFQLVHKN